jgi:hypothetical protein
MGGGHGGLRVTRGLLAGAQVFWRPLLSPHWPLECDPRLVGVLAKTKPATPSSPWPRDGYGSGARVARVWKLRG